jgi:hypothetical protein
METPAKKQVPNPNLKELNEKSTGTTGPWQQLPNQKAGPKETEPLRTPKTRKRNITMATWAKPKGESSKQLRTRTMANAG